MRISLLGGQLLDFEIDTSKPTDEPPPLPFGFGPTAGAQVEVAADLDPLQDRP